MKFVVLGAPMGKQRPRVVKGHAYTPRKTVEYEREVRGAYTEQVGKFYFDGALTVCIDAYYPIPKSASKKARQKMLSGELMPVKKPDYDNIGKIVCDSLNGLAYKDDCQIVDGRVRKFYSETPRVEVTIEPYEA